ncbi:MAG: efflux RND transporter periplasmic adaptor subunit [Opitutae bacterium]|nr:efflux RND transporter periplasmic adaptor subunit [Opitutae bacterium]
MKPARPLLPVLALALLAGCAKHSDSTARAGANLPSAKVRVAAVRTESLAVRTELTGSVRPVQRAVLAAKIMGAVSELPVALGQAVNAGDLLVRLTAAEIGARVAQAQAGLSQVQRDLARERELLPKGASTADLVKNLEDRLAQAQALVREAEAMRDYTALRAPFAGVVARKFVTAGDLAAPGQPLVEIEGTDAFEIELGIPDSLAAGLAANSTLAVAVPATGVAFEAALRELSSASDAQARSVTAKLTVPAGAKVRSGQFVRVTVPGAAAPALLVPATAVSRLGQMERVFAVREGAAELRLVKTGATHGDRVEILAGLSAGDRIVAVPASLRDGQPVEVLP